MEPDEVSDTLSLSTAEIALPNAEELSRVTTALPGAKERSKGKQHKLSARLALLSKGGQKNTVFKPKDLSEQKDQKSTIEGGYLSDIVTSDYDSCIEGEVECGGCEGVKGECDGVKACDYDDADSGVVENSTGAMVASSDLGDLKEVDLLDECSSASSVADQERISKLLASLDQKVDIGSLTEEALELLQHIPDGYIPLPHQVGGHRHVEGKLGFLRQIGHPDILYKPVQYGSKGTREVQFYEMIYNTPDSELNPDLCRLKELIPRYHGQVEIRDHYGDVEPYILLEDIASRFSQPCIMDIKVGKRVYDDFAQQDKIDREMRKFPAQELIGFRIIGMRVLRGSNYVYFNKEFGRSMTVETTLPSIREFFFDGACIRDDIICALIDQLQRYQELVASQKSFKLFATSILIVYEGDQTIPCDSEADLLDVKLVDFAHAYSREAWENGPDENFLFGLKSFISYLHRLK